MNVLSLFDGMSCGQIAFERANIKVNKYYASELDKYAIKVTMKNYPNTIQLGDVVKLRRYLEKPLLYERMLDSSFVKEESKQLIYHCIDILLDGIDVLIGGSPCQGFSFAGKQLNFNDPRSALFFEYVKIKEILKPKYFLLENVKMKKEYQDIISSYLGVEPIEINSALVSAQNRKRLYWTNIPNIEQPKDKGILLQDILEDGVDRKYYFQDRIGTTITGKNSLNKIRTSLRDGLQKSKCLTAAGQGISNAGCTNIVEINKATIIGRRLNSEGHREDYNKDIPITQCLEVRKDNSKPNCLTTVEKDNIITNIEIGRHPDIYNKSKKMFNVNPSGKGMNGWVYDPEYKSPTITTNKGEGSKVFNENSDKLFRTLTPLECERLQTVPSNEIICIFTSCLDQVKNYVNAVEKNPKLLKLALSAEKEELNEFVKLVTQNTKQNHPQTRFIVPQNADMTTWKQTNQCTKVSQKENNITVSNVENIVMSKNQNQEVDSVLPNAFINIIEGRIMHFGKEELPLKDKNCANQMNGNKPLVLFGKEIMGLVKDVDVGMKKNGDMTFTSTILSALSINSLEQMLATYYFFAKNAITGYTQNTTSQKSLSVQFQINDGYTACVSNSQRYKMLGNGWTVDVIAHIFSFIKQ